LGVFKEFLESFERDRETQRERERERERGFHVFVEQDQSSNL
jgi:hypothetical protein